MIKYTIEVTVWDTPDGKPTCRLSNEYSCRFLGFRDFGSIPVCMCGEQKDLFEYENGFIQAGCFMKPQE